VPKWGFCDIVGGICDADVPPQERWNKVKSFFILS